MNLAPADLPKEGSHYDLAIALAILAAIGAIPRDSLEGVAAIGELALDGGLAQTAGALPAAMAAEAMEMALVCPASCGAEAAWSGGTVLAAPQPHHAGQPFQRHASDHAGEVRTAGGRARRRRTCAT